MVLSKISKRTLLIFTAALPAFAQNAPWDTASANMKAAFTGPIATSLMAVAIVVCGLTFAFSESGKRQLSGILFGGAMAIGAVRFSAWLFT